MSEASENERYTGTGSGGKRGPKRQRTSNIQLDLVASGSQQGAGAGGRDGEEKAASADNTPASARADAPISSRTRKRL